MTDKSHLPVDRGWAWVICIACTVQTFIIAGVYRSYGLLFVEFMDKFHAGASDISLILSLQQIFSSITSYFVMTVGPLLFSIRQLVLFGSFIIAISFFISAFVTVLPVFLFSQGILFGFGISFVMAPSLVLVGKYFEKRRGFTNSILKFGGGLGALTFAPFIRYLLVELGIDGTLIILSGLLFNLIPCGCLLRSLEFYEKRKNLQVTDDYEENKLKEPDQGNIEVKDKTVSINKEINCNGTKIWDPLLDDVTNNVNSFDGNKNTMIHYYSHDKLNEKSRRNYTRTFSTSSNYDGIRVVHRNNHQPSLGLGNSSLSHSSVALYGAIGEFGGSVGHIPPSEKREENFVRNDDIDRKCCHNVRNVTMKQILTKILAFKLLKNKLFLLLAISTTFGIIGFAYINTFIPPYAKDIGIGPNERPLLVSIISISDLVGKFITAFISDKKYVKRYLVLAISMLVLGVSSQLIPFLTEFWSLAIYCGIYGLFGGFFIAIFIVVVIDFVGIENLSSALGILILDHGGTLAASAPFLGYLRDSTGSYVYPFHVMGACSIVGGCLLLMEPIARKLEEKSSKSKEQDPLAT